MFYPSDEVFKSTVHEKKHTRDSVRTTRITRAHSSLKKPLKSSITTFEMAELTEVPCFPCLCYGTCAYPAGNVYKTSSQRKR